jgi:predicted RNA-binding Zn ribbon-like protein
MSTPKTIDDINLLGGHVALDLVNTVDSRGDKWGPDYLVSYPDLADWALRVDLIDRSEHASLLKEAQAGPAAADVELENAKKLREILHRIFGGEERDAAPLEADLDFLSSACAQAAARQKLRAKEGGVIWTHVPPASMTDIAFRIALSAAELLTSRQQRRPVRICHGRNCGWLFLDLSRGGHRRWCSDKTCGSATRVRKFRADRVG